MFKSPISAPLLPWAQKYPDQAHAIARTWDDLSLVQGWSDLKVVDCEESSCVAFKGKQKGKDFESVVLPSPLSTPTNLQKLASVFEATSADLIYIGIVEKDSSVVYYVLKKGIVSPSEVPE
ncbi:hypothetical protein T439DRAFT_325735 [Meredithblackwellia eburnea MCA 4105]